MKSVTLAHASAERTILGAMMLDAPSVMEQWPSLTGEMFYNSQHGELFDLMVSLLQREIPVGIDTVADEARHDPSRYGRLPDIVSLPDNVPSTHVKHWCKRVQDLHHSRRMQAKLKDALLALEGGAQAADVQGLLDSAEKDAEVSTGWRRVQDVAGDATSESIERRQMSHDGRNIFLPMPTKALSDHIKIPVGQKFLMTLGARPSHGKTSVAFDIARKVASSQVWDARDGGWVPGRVAVVSLEMPDVQLVKRLGTQFSGYNFNHFEENVHDGERAHAYIRGLEQAASMAMWIDDRPARSPEEVCRSLRRLTRIHGPPHLVVVDYAEKFSFPGFKPSEMPAAILHMCGLLNDTMKTIGAACLLLSQLKRDIDSRPGNRPMLSDFSASSGIEKESDLCCAIGRPARYTNTDKGGEMGMSMSPVDDTMNWDIFKNRNGKTGRFQTGWSGERFSIYDKGTERYAKVAR